MPEETSELIDWIGSSVSYYSGIELGVGKTGQAWRLPSLHTYQISHLLSSVRTIGDPALHSNVF